MDDMTVVGEARLEQFERIAAGETLRCTCCNRVLKLYRRKINRGMATSLVRMMRSAGNNGWVQITTTLPARSREEGKLAYWGLVEESNERRDDGGRAGWWRVTDRGLLFARNMVALPKYALVYNGQVSGFEGPDVFITDAFDDPFDYRELMQ